MNARDLRRSRGFTLLELLMVIAIAAIVATVAIPSFRAMTQNNRMVTQANDLITALNLARTEALRRGRPVALCHSASPGVAAPVCGGTGSSWGTGWLVFAVGVGNATSPRTYQATTDELIRIGEPATGMTLTGNAMAATSIEFAPDGTYSGAPQTARVALCDDRGAASGREIVVRPVGRAHVDNPVSDCTNPS